MKDFFGYIRISDVKQKAGVSRQMQKKANQTYANRYRIRITRWFVETATAAKKGRKSFNEMLRLLQKGKADGVVIHKVDRSARNLRDWVDLTDLLDQDIDIYFSNESFDLRTRGGRLAADMQAVVASDFIRNLREEVRKGIRGRLEQGFYPRPAPLGYLNMGKKKRKKIDPIQGPRVREAAELYDTGRYSLQTLSEEMWRRGLRSKTGRKVTVRQLSLLFRNPFPIGLIYMKSSGETFKGNHEPLYGKGLYDRIQRRLDGKARRADTKHQFPFRRMLRCSHCGYSLIGERQKGHVYYRCHTRGCPTSGIREEVIEDEFLQALKPLQFTKREDDYFREKILQLRAEWTDNCKARIRATELNLAQLEARLGRLTDALIDGTIGKEVFDARNKTLLMDKEGLEEKLVEMREEATSTPDELEEFLERARTAYSSYKEAEAEEKRDLLESVTSNQEITGKNVSVKLLSGFSDIANRCQMSCGAPERGTPRTLDALIQQIIRVLEQRESGVILTG